MSYRDILQDTKPKKRPKVWFKIQDLVYPEGIYLNQGQMIKYAKKMLSINKRVHGLDKEVMSTDLNEPINAWVYLKNIGLGVETNHPKRWD